MNNLLKILFVFSLVLTAHTSGHAGSKWRFASSPAAQRARQEAKKLASKVAQPSRSIRAAASRRLRLRGVPKKVRKDPYLSWMLKSGEIKWGHKVAKDGRGLKKGKKVPTLILRGGTQVGPFKDLNRLLMAMRALDELSDN